MRPLSIVLTLILFSAPCDDNPPDLSQYVDRPAVYYLTHNSLRVVTPDGDERTIVGPSEIENGFGLHLLMEDEGWVADNDEGASEFEHNRDAISWLPGLAGYVPVNNTPSMTDIRPWSADSVLIAAFTEVQVVNTKSFGYRVLTQNTYPLSWQKGQSFGIEYRPEVNPWVYFGNYPNGVSRIKPYTRTVETLADGFQVVTPAYMEMSDAEVLYVADPGRDCIVEIDIKPSFGSGAYPVADLACGGLLADPNNDPMFGPWGLAIDPATTDILVTVNPGPDANGHHAGYIVSVHMDGSITKWYDAAPDPRDLAVVHPTDDWYNNRVPVDNSENETPARR